jgi:hypothetical protein
MQVPVAQAVNELHELLREVAKGQEVVIIGRMGWPSNLSPCHVFPDLFLVVRRDWCPSVQILMNRLRVFWKYIDRDRVADYAAAARGWL